MIYDTIEVIVRYCLFEYFGKHRKDVDLMLLNFYS